MVPPSTSMSTLPRVALERLIDGHADDGHDQAISEVIDAPLRADRRHLSEDDLPRAACAFNEWNRRAFLRHRRGGAHASPSVVATASLKTRMRGKSERGEHQDPKNPQ